MPLEKDTRARAIGRYVLFRQVAQGGMATVHLGRLRGPAGFARTVAIKRLHPQFARDPEFVSMFLDEARLAARVQHPNVVSVLDVVAAEGELFLVMDYVHGESFSKLQRLARDANSPITPRIVAAVVSNVLDGLQAAHEARNERGDPLDIVHRDVSPQNVLVGVDGVARVLDFGIAKATERAHATTRDGQMKGKVPYMAPEQVGQGQLDRRTDVYATAVMLWEALTGHRLFPSVDVVQLLQLIMSRQHPPPSSLNPEVSPQLDAVVLKGLAPDPAKRWSTAREMAVALEAACAHATAREVGEWVSRFAEAPLGQRAQSIAEIENTALPAHLSSAKVPLGRMVASSEAASVAAGALEDRTDVDGTDSISPPPITGSTGVPAGVPRPRRARWLAVLGAAGVVVLFLFAIALTSSGSRRPSGAPLPALSAVAVVAPTIPPPPSSPPEAVMPDPAPPAESASTAPAVRRAPAPASRPAARAGGCSPPYTIDANGVRIPKRQCL